MGPSAADMDGVEGFPGEQCNSHRALFSLAARGTSRGGDTIDRSARPREHSIPPASYSHHTQNSRRRIPLTRSAADSLLEKPSTSMCMKAMTSPHEILDWTNRDGTKMRGDVAALPRHSWPKAIDSGDASEPLYSRVILDGIDRKRNKHPAASCGELAPQRFKQLMGTGLLTCRYGMAIQRLIT